jgi:hypothetical protein
MAIMPGELVLPTTGERVARFKPGKCGDRIFYMKFVSMASGQWLDIEFRNTATTRFKRCTGRPRDRRATLTLHSAFAKGQTSLASSSMTPPAAANPDADYET